MLSSVQVPVPDLLASFQSPTSGTEKQTIPKPALGCHWAGNLRSRQLCLSAEGTATSAPTHRGCSSLLPASWEACLAPVPKRDTRLMPAGPDRVFRGRTEMPLSSHTWIYNYLFMYFGHWMKELGKPGKAISSLSTPQPRGPSVHHWMENKNQGGGIPNYNSHTFTTVKETGVLVVL